MLAAKRPADLPALKSQLRRGLALAWLGTSMSLLALFGLVWIAVRRTLGIVLALIVLFEQWGWQPLLAALIRITHVAPIAAIERGIVKLPPYGALVTFALPTALLVPLKLLALYLIANGHALSAGLLFIVAKLVGTAIVARLYQLTEPQLMQIGWVRRVRDVVLPRLHALHAAIRQSWAWRYGRVLKFQAKRALAPLVLWVRGRLGSFRF